MNAGPLAGETGLCAVCRKPLTGQSAGATCIECVFDELTGFTLTEKAEAITEVTARLQLGPYLLVEVIGRGGMGIVYRAREQNLRRDVALKTISGIFLPGEPATLRFKQEAAATARLHHPNIVPIYEFGEIDAQLYFTMQLIEGAVPADRMAEEKKRDPHWCAGIVATVAEAIQYAHQRGVLHRDLKPANILIDEAGKPWVTDFGLAKMEEEQSFTQSGMHMGTPAYMAPEQCEGPGTQVTTLADVYALGALLYDLLTGRPPFTGANALDTMRRVVDEDLKPPRRIDPAIPRDLEAICLKCMEKSVIRRYSSALALRDDLQAWQEDRPVLARRPGVGYRLAKWCRRRPAPAALIAVALALLVMAGFYVVEKGARVQEIRERHQLKRGHYAVDMLLASQALEAGNLELAAARLQDHVPVNGEEDVRGFEWYAYRKEVDGEQLRILKSPPVGAVDVLAMSGDGRSLAAAGRDFIWHWDLGAGAPEGRLFWKPGQPGGPAKAGGTFTNLELSDEGSVLLATSSTGVWMWTVPAGSPRPVPSDALPPATLHPRGNLLAARAKTVGWKLWDLDSGEPVWERMEKIKALDISANGERIVFHAPRTPTVMELMSQKVLGSLKTTPNGELRATFLSENGERVLSQFEGADKGLQIFTVGVSFPHLWKWAYPFTGMTLREKPYTLLFSDTRPSLRRIYDPMVKSRQIPMQGHSRAIRCMASDRSVARTATASDDGTIRIWDNSARVVGETTVPAPKDAERIVPAPGDRGIAVGGVIVDCGPARPGGSEVAQDCRWGAFHTERAEFVGIAAAGGATPSLRWSRSASAVPLEGAPPSGKPRRWLFSSGGFWVAAVQADGSGALWSTASGRRMAAWTLKPAVGAAAALSPSGRWLALGVKQGLAVLDLTLPDAAVFRTLPLEPGASFASFSSDSGKLAICQVDSDRWMSWNFEKSTQPESFVGHFEPVITARFSPDGLSAITTAHDNTVKLWSLRTRREVASKTGSSDDMLSDATYAPDESFVAWLSSAGALHVWRR